MDRYLIYLLIQLPVIYGPLTRLILVLTCRAQYLIGMEPLGFFPKTGVRMFLSMQLSLIKMGLFGLAERMAVAQHRIPLSFKN